MMGVLILYFLEIKMKKKLTLLGDEDNTDEPLRLVVVKTSEKTILIEKLSGQSFQKN